ncbi:MAG: aminomethyl-transferring glycine dehydrogenase subunit GcvPB [Candidatus Omnitrophica bacterium]|nr:aminomethyl-transferring glycine dehydrogenase subunit GcvPB [Candidatus Omnitrophota bacterium]
MSALQKTPSLIFEKGVPGRRAVTLPNEKARLKAQDYLPQSLLRKEPAALPELSELDVVRHFTALSQLNYSIDTQFYPLGSCTMKYNPKVNNWVAALPGFANLHPYQPAQSAQGLLQLLHELEQALCEICGMAAFSLQPAAGAHGELSGVLMARAYHSKNGNPRKRVIVPDSAHGTNPATAAICGYEVTEIPSAPDGRVDLQALKAALDEDVAVFMLTNPNTLGLFEKNILQIAELVHSVGALLYLDGANLNALLGLTRPGDMGFDIVHVNLHKTFSTPHGGGGPGAGPVGVTKALEPFLPVPRLEKRNSGFEWNGSQPESIGRVRSFYGNAGVLVRAYAYIRALGGEGLRAVSENAILNANYLKTLLERLGLQAAGSGACMHEFVVSLSALKDLGINALDVAKRLLDYGFHAPTIYFPLIVPEAFMLEPTETESKQTLDAFALALKQILKEARTQPELLHEAPHSTPIGRMDEVTAARKPELSWRSGIASGAYAC